MAMKHWEHFVHGSDIGVCGIGETCAQAFEQAAVALSAIVTDPALIRPLEKVEFACVAPDTDLLLTDWLNAIIYEMATRHMLFGKYHVELEGTHLTASGWGESVDPLRHQPTVEPKGATLTHLYVGRQENGLWQAKCVIDV